MSTKSEGNRKLIRIFVETMEQNIDMLEKIVNELEDDLQYVRGNSNTPLVYSEEVGKPLSTETSLSSTLDAYNSRLYHLRDVLIRIKDELEV